MRQREFTIKKTAESKNIFISYGHDRFAELAIKIKDDLIRLGHSVWFDVEKLKGGKDWEIYIENGLRGAEIVIVMMTPHSVRRPFGFCLDEISMARTLNKDILPIMVREVIPPLSIHRLQWLDFREWPFSDEKYKEKFKLIQEFIEGKILSFEGGHTTLLKELDPIDFKAEIDKHTSGFYGRKWIFDKIKDWLYNNRESKAFFLVGKPGVGKTAICSMLCQNLPEVKAYHLVKYGDIRKSDALECVLSLAYQLSTQILDYAEILMKFNFEGIRLKNSETVFDELIIQPLSKIDTPLKPVLIVIDAIDEAKKEKGNELVSFLANNFDLTPPWLKLFITSRPEPDILNSLASLKPYSLDTDDARNLSDIKGYLELNLKELFPNKNTEKAIDIILECSEGVFLYAQEVVNEFKIGRLTLEHPEDFPIGLKGVYKRFFKRQFPEKEKYDKHQRPLLELITAAKEPLNIKLIQELLNWIDPYSKKDSIDPLGSFIDIEDGKISFFHKSLIEWLTDPQTSKDFFISNLEGHKALVKYGWNLYTSDFEELPRYFFKYLPLHLLVLNQSDMLAKLFSDQKFTKKIAYSGFLNYPESLLRLYYRERGIKNDQIDFLIDIKNLINRPLPIIEDFKENEFGDPDFEEMYLIALEIGIKIQHRNIIGLNLNFQRLDRLPDSIKTLQSVIELNLSDNIINSLPEGICNLNSLNLLDLSANNMKSLPTCLKNLKRIQTLNLGDNKFDTFPNVICDLKSLNILDLSKNNMKSLPICLKNLKRIRTFNLGDNKFDTFPKVICHLNSLNLLNLEKNHISELPSTISNLVKLEEMNLDYNNLTSLPITIGNLKLLKRMHLIRNPSFTFPKSMENLKKLKILTMDIPQIIETSREMRSILNNLKQSGCSIKTYSDKHAKILLVGDNDPQIIRLLYPSSTKKKQIIGIDILAREINLDSKIHPISIWNAGDQLRFGSLIKFFIQQADGGIIILNLTNDESIKKLADWVNFFRNDDPDLPILLVGNRHENYAKKLLERFNLSNYVELDPEKPESFINEILVKLVRKLIW